MRLFIANLKFTAEPDELEQLFADHGVTLTNIVFVNDRETGNFRGFGFAEVNIPREHQAALDMNGVLFLGRELIVNEAENRERPAHSGGRKHYR